MATLNHLLLSSPIFPSHNPMITIDHEGFASEKWYPYHQSIVSNTPVFSVTSHLPVSVTARVLDHVETHSYFDDFYHRIHIAPQTLALGNVASEQSTNLFVWNAHFDAKQLNEITGIGDGIELSGQPEPPFNFNALQERPWRISIRSDGPASIDNTVNFDFGAEVPYLHITGNRIVPFGFLVDWKNQVKETLQWQTDILQSQTGHEQRRSLRLAPRIQFDVDLLLTDQERQFFDLTMICWSARNFAIPIWPQQQWLNAEHPAGGMVIYCDTTHRNFIADRLVFLRTTSLHNEVAQIESVLPDRIILKRPLQKTWPKGTCLSPAATAQLMQLPNVIKRTESMMRSSCAFLVTETIEHSANMPDLQYRSYPILTAKPNEKDDLTHSYERLLQTLDSGTGLIRRDDLAEVAFSVYQYAWMTYGRSEQSALRALFYALRGSQKAIWLPTFSTDLTVNAPIAVGSIIPVQWCGYSRFGFGQLGRQDIQITLRNGTVLYRRIVAATEMSDSTEYLEVDQAFGSMLQVNDVLNISFMSLCRLNTDTVVIEHLNDSDGIAKSSATFRGVRES